MPQSPRFACWVMPTLCCAPVPLPYSTFMIRQRQLDTHKPHKSLFKIEIINYAHLLCGTTNSKSCCQNLACSWSHYVLATLSCRAVRTSAAPRPHSASCEASCKNWAPDRLWWRFYSLFWPGQSPGSTETHTHMHLCCIFLSSYIQQVYGPSAGFW